MSLVMMRGFALELNFVCGPSTFLIVVCHIAQRDYPSVKLIFNVLEEFWFRVAVLAQLGGYYCHKYP